MWSDDFTLMVQNPLLLLIPKPPKNLPKGKHGKHTIPLTICNIRSIGVVFSFMKLKDKTKCIDYEDEKQRI